MQTNLTELDFTKAIIQELAFHNILKFNIHDLEYYLYNYDLTNHHFDPLFKNINCTCEHLDLSDAIWYLTNFGIINFDYPEVEIKEAITKINIAPSYLALIHELIEEYLKRKNIEESSSMEINIIKTSPNKNEYPILEGEYDGKEIRWNLITNGDIFYENIPKCLNIREITDSYITVKNASYVIQNCYVNGQLTHIDIYTELKKAQELEDIKNIALNSDINIRLLRKKDEK